MRSRDMDMLHGSLTDKLVLFTIPLALSSIVQQLFNSADLAVWEDSIRVRRWRLSAATRR